MLLTLSYLLILQIATNKRYTYCVFDSEFDNVQHQVSICYVRHESDGGAIRWESRWMMCGSIGGLGNKKVTSKRHYMYQWLDGEASISCYWQQVSRQSQVIWWPRMRHRPITGRLFQIVLTTRSGSWLQVTAGVLRFVQKIYRVTSVFLCGASFISFVESQFLVYV